MLKKALLLNSWYGKPEENWYFWMKSELEKKEYTVFFPELPTMCTDLPDPEPQLKTINETLTVDEQTLVIGHSLGSLLALRLAEFKPVGKMILISGWDFNDLTTEHRLFWKTPIDHEKIKRHCKEIIVVSSDNDPYITACQAEDMSKRLAGKFVLVPGAGHFTTKYKVTSIPEILEFI